MQDEYVAKQSYILAIDEGTTGTTSLLINGDGQVVSKAYQEVHAIYPQPGWVEEDAQELFQRLFPERTQRFKIPASISRW